MIDFRKNPTENITANILWQYVSRAMNESLFGSKMPKNSLGFNSKYLYNGINKVTEMVVNINGNSIRIDSKYLSKGSNFVNTIANDILALNNVDEDNIIFVCNGKGFENNKSFEALKLEISNNTYLNKNIEFVMLNNLDKHIQETYNVLPNWEKRSRLIKELQNF